MDKHIARLNAVLAGFGSAFALMPSGALDQYLQRESVESRIHANFLRVGLRMDAAMKRGKDEQEKSAQQPTG